MGRARPIRVVLAVLATVAGLAVGGAAPVGAAVPPAKAFTVAASPAAPVWSQAVKLSASITPKGGGAPRGGTVTFLADGVPLGTATATTRIATLTTRAIPVGTHQLTAEYAGDDRTAPGTTAPVAITVGPAPTALDLTSRVDPIASGAAAELRAVVRSIAPANTSIRPTGVVTFTAGSRTGVVPVNANGVATWRPKLADGIHAVTATYGGSDLHQPVAADGFDIQVGAESAPDVTVLVEEEGRVNVDNTSSEGGTSEIGQVFTAGRTGWLDAVDIVARVATTTRPPQPLVVGIQAVDVNGIPTGPILGEGELAAADAQPLNHIPLTRPARVTAGTRYAFTVSIAPDAPPNGAPWEVAYAPNTSYAGHAGIYRIDRIEWYPATSDLVFQTWILDSPNR